ncbi:hypothetical protein EDB80DRAFT_758210 [Ilyonectria destructans]|nr:hypothetical protein EDB80DRAFT_758210 [Ilyonectria destructans]
MAPTFDETTRASELVPYYANQIAGKTILITGISSGSLGESFVKQVFIGKPAAFVLAGRSPSKFRSLVDYLASAHPNTTVKSLALDLTSLANSDVPRIDVLVNNAGIMAVPYRLTEDGFESQLQTNHLGHFLFTNLIMDKILASKAPRVVHISSVGHRHSHIRWADYNFSDGQLYDKWTAYGQSKTATALTALALAEKLGSKGLVSFSVCPGSVGTNLAAHEAHNLAAFVKDFQAAGASTHVFAAFDQDVAKHSGAYLNHCRLADPYAEEVWPWATSETSADMLWQLSEKLVGQELKY